MLLSHFSRVQLCVTPQTAAHQAPPTLGFSRQEHWSGLPFPSPKETISKVKRQPSEWEKIIANKTTDKGFISKIYKQLVQLNTKKKQTVQSDGMGKEEGGGFRMGNTCIPVVDSF